MQGKRIVQTACILLAVLLPGLLAWTGHMAVCRALLLCLEASACIWALYTVIKDMRNRTWYPHLPGRMALAVSCLVRFCVLLSSYTAGGPEQLMAHTAISGSLLLQLSLFPLAFLTCWLTGGLCLRMHREGWSTGLFLYIPACLLWFIFRLLLFLFVPVSVRGFVFLSFLLYPDSFLLACVICTITLLSLPPRMDREAVIILGSGLRRDGTLTPLLKGRTDRAVTFAEKQAAHTGHMPLLVPSGGQGKNEVIPEGEAIRRYLVSLGMDEKQIIPEKKAASTRENLSYSIQLSGCSLFAFATSDFHVLRTAMYAQKLGFSMDALGSPTKWYFLPQAFVREVLGIAFGNRHQLILILLFLVLAWLPLYLL